ncbi:hypothetical protein AMJ44_06480 [candidate division WOR-1 bacterium DG_54_3]|uniref:Uncharacterized protein n=1 Tax=candidate division WOR-1 bacterium DG_54_3 TaxID=1703775 RepID=A0A0S7Y194_UNCSA|nr:MAG: hypothetical protein AMJ44_06480 [candidate division WOR-1 bacterium DG_54_3]
MSDKEKDPLQQLEDILKDFWKENGNPHIIAAKHTEFMVEPKIFMGDKLNPEILKLLVINYLAQTSKQDSGTGNIDVSPEKLVIKSPKGKPLVVVRDKKVIQQYIAQRV